MSWSTLKDLHAQVLRLWERGVLARAAFAPDANPAFPIRLKLSAPSGRELSDQFEDVRTWIASMQAITTLRIEWREIQHRVLGAQRIPHAIWLDDFAAAVELIKKRGPAAQLQQVIAQTQAFIPALLTWVWTHPARAIDLAPQWDKLLATVQWRVQHPKPGIYLRQVDIPGIHSKFIENHRTVLSALFEIALDASAQRDGIEQAPTTGQSFATRFGFLDRPLRIRFRPLDPRLALIANTTRADLKLDAINFAQLDFEQYQAPLQQVFITENEINYLTFPEVANALVIFGAGYGWEALAKARWLHTRHLHYWGDIDTHGFAILHQLRQYFPRVRSMLMDHATLMQHESVWGTESDQHKADLNRLSTEESAVYNLLRDNRLRTGLRLEQEHIGYGWVQRAVDAAVIALAPNR
jgi:hypothetical protein